MRRRALGLALALALASCGSQPPTAPLPTPFEDTYPVPAAEEQPAPAPSLPDPRTGVTLLVKDRPVSEVLFLLAELHGFPLTLDDGAYARARTKRITLASHGASLACVLNWCARAADTRVHWWSCPPRVHLGSKEPQDALAEIPLGLDLTGLLEDFNPQSPPRAFTYRTDPKARREAARKLRSTLEAEIRSQKKPNPELAAALETDEDLKALLEKLGEKDIKSWAEILSRGSSWTPEDLRSRGTADKVDYFRTHVKRKLEALDKPLKAFIAEEERGLREVEAAMKAADDEGDRQYSAFLESREREGAMISALAIRRAGRPLGLKLLEHGAVLTGRCRPHEASMAAELVEAMGRPSPPKSMEGLMLIEKAEAAAAKALGKNVSNNLRARWLEDVLFEWASEAKFSLAFSTDALPSKGQALVNRSNGLLPALQSLREICTQHNLPPPVEDDPGCLWIGPDTSWRFADPQPGTLRAFVLPDADRVLLGLEAALEGGPGFAARGPGNLLVVCLPAHRERLLWQALEARHPAGR